MGAEITLGGLTPLTTIDLPGCLSAVVYCQGCPWRCPYCHNPQLLPARGTGALGWQELMAFLERRRGLLDGVVFSGGEPTLQRGLADALRQVRALGFRTGLHTAGPYPRRLARALSWLDWVGMDIKAPFGDYEGVTGVPGSGDRARQSARLIVNSGVSYEFRTTVDGPLLEPGRLARLARELEALGARHYVLQECRSGPAPRTVIPEAATVDLAPRFDSFTVRAAAGP